MRVIAALYENGVLFIIDTLYPTIGFYSVSAGKLPNKQGDINAKVWASAPGYAPVLVDTTVEWFQVPITVNIALAPTAVRMPLCSRAPAGAHPGALYTIDGRRAALVKGHAGLASVNARPMRVLVLRRQDR